ncbi:hypothetical protein DS62_13830 [Smithella sp. SC_K08D17]|nr:hypothetical protein DS62_13830 [Smithella sp. SC_K08D17]
MNLVVVCKKHPRLSLFGMAVCLGVILALYLITIFVMKDKESDFTKFYLSGQYFWAGEDIYKPVIF